MKICKDCKIEQEIERYTKDKSRKDGLSDWCKACLALYRFINRDKNRARRKIYYRNNLTDEYKAYLVIYRKSRKHIQQKWERENYTRRKEYRRIYFENNPHIKKKISENIKKKRREIPMVKLTCALRSRIYAAIKNFDLKKQSSIKSILGADIKTVKAFIEKQFKKGMTWENHGQYGWHIDHKIPFSSAKTEEELLILCHYTNLQPLWAKENLSKGDKILSIQTTLPI